MFIKLKVIVACPASVREINNIWLAASKSSGFSKGYIELTIACTVLMLIVVIRLRYFFVE
jgi:hypothetical protein